MTLTQIHGRSKTKLVTALIFVFVCSVGHAQKPDGYFQLQLDTTGLLRASNKSIWQKISFLDADGGLDYITPIRYRFFLKDTLISLMGAHGYYETLGTGLSCMGDYENGVKEFNNAEQIKSHVDLNVHDYDDIRPQDPFDYIIERAKCTKVVMFNEAHHVPQHRLFTTLLLKVLKDIGYKYLALEGLSNTATITEVNKISPRMGYYMMEPLYADLARKALLLGLRLIAYEDTSKNNFGRYSRDSAQAQNLYSVLKNDPEAKIIVHAGYGHIEENHSPPSMMASYLKAFSGVDPFTIDQLMFSEQLAGDFRYQLYNYWQKKYGIKDIVTLYQNDSPWVFGSRLVDMYILHPPAIYQNGRPKWLGNSRYRKKVLLKLPKRLSQNGFWYRRICLTKSWNLKI